VQFTVGTVTANQQSMANLTKLLNSTQLYFRQTMNNSKRAKISDICLTGRQGRHSALMDRKSFIDTVNQTQKLVEIKNNKPTIKTYLIYF